MIEKASVEYVVNSSFVVMATPEQLRHIANCMESKERVTLPGMNMTYQLTRNVLLMYDPQITMEKLEKEITAEVLKSVTSSTNPSSEQSSDKSAPT